MFYLLLVLLEVKKIDNSKAGSYEIVYKINYLGTPYSETRYVHVK